MSCAPKGPRRAMDAYYTPDALASYLVRLTAQRWGLDGTIVEPSCGGGAFLREITGRPATYTIGIDANPDAPGLGMADSAHVGDFLEWNTGDPVRWILGNPPYGAFLLRLAFLESSRRVAFWRSHPCRYVGVLAQRPSFTGGGTDATAYGWFVWRRGLEGLPTHLEVLSWK